MDKEVYTKLAEGFELLEAVDEYVSFVQAEIEEARRVCKDPVFTVEQRVDASEYVEGRSVRKYSSGDEDFLS